MDSIRQLWERNANTFYDASNGRKYSLRLRYLVLGSIAVLLAIGLPYSHDELFQNLITSLAILIGFTFNVLIFVASTARLSIGAAHSLERNQKRIKLNKLSEELFYNLSYFNAIALFAVVLTLWIVASGRMPILAYERVHACLASVGLEQVSLKAVQSIGSVSQSLTIALLVGAVLESFLTFVRIIRRSSYYFQERLQQ